MPKPMMERRHFELIARMVRELRDDTFTTGVTITQREMLANQFATALKPTNPSFNRARFLAACGVEE